MSVENVLRLLEMVTADKQVRADFESIGDALEQFKPEGLRAMVERIRKLAKPKPPTD